MSWWTITPILLVTVALMLLPGLLLSVALGFRRLVAVGLAPLFSVAVAGVSAVLGSLVGVPWSVWLLAVATAVFCLVALLVSRRFSPPAGADDRTPADSAGLLLWAGGGSAVGGLLIAWRTATLVGNPENIAQRFDNVFHLNAVQYILTTGDGSSLTLGQMTGNTGVGAVYPAVWHALAALVVELTGTSVAIAVNALNLVIVAVAWPLSVVLLARVVAGPRAVVLCSAGLLSAAFIGFPYLMMVWGPLFPYMLSVALLPAGLAAVLILIRMAPGLPYPGIPAAAAVLVGVAGLGLAHLSTVNTLLLLGLPAVGVRLFRIDRRDGRAAMDARSALVRAGIAVAGAAVFLIIWLKLRPAPYDFWGPHQTPAGAVGEVLAYSPMNHPLVPVAVSVLAVVGIGHLLRRPGTRWFLVSFGLVGYLYVVDAGLQRGRWRDFMTGIWYSDTNRLAAILPIFGVVLGALGVWALASALMALLRRVPAITRLDGRFRAAAFAPRAVGGVAVFVVLVAALASSTQTRPLGMYIEDSEAYYLRDTPTSILSSDEYALLERVPDIVPPDALIAGNPWNGSTLVFAFTGREVLSHHMFESRSPEAVAVAESLDEAPANEQACEAIRETGVSYVLDFGTQYLAQNDATDHYTGLDDLATSSAVRLVDEEGSARLYEIVVCQSP